MACGKKGSDSKKQVRLGHEDIVRLLEAQSFSCASVEGEECPDGLARAFILDEVDPNLSALCTAFVTGPNTIVTNSHCVSTPDQCENTYFSVHVQGTSEVARCRRIIKSLDDGELLVNKALDVTVIELDRNVSAPPLKLSRQKVSSGDKVSAWVVDHMDLLEGRLTELECVYLGSSASMEFARCPAVSGNSGSPILNSQKEVVGVLWGSTLDPSFTEDIALETRRELTAYSFATEVRYFRSHSLP